MLRSTQFYATNILEQSGWNVVIRHQGIPGQIAILLIGVVIGYLRLLKKRLNKELNTRIEAEKSLKQSEKTFRELFEASSEGLHLVSMKTGKFVKVNNAMCSLFGYTREEMLQLSPQDICTPDDRERQSEALKLLMAGKRIVNHEGVCIKKDGTRLSVLISAFPLLWKGQYVISGCIRDISQIKEYQEKLTAKNREILDFANTVTHDMKKPLTTIKTICTLVADEKFFSLSGDGKEAIVMGKDALNYMEELLEDLLACAKLEAGTQVLEMTDVDVKEVVDTVLQRYKFQIEEKNITVVRNDNVYIHADKKGIIKIFMNLIGNAIGYIGNTPDPEVEIGVSELNDRNKYLFTVRDNGLGIPEEIQGTIFQKFKRGTNVSGISGAGLGLSIVKGIIEAHKGEIWLESKEGEGTTFYFTLPFKKV